MLNSKRYRLVKFFLIAFALGLSSISYAQPANDDCGSATTLSVGTTFATYSVSGNSASGTQSIPAITCASATGNADDDVWYKFVATCDKITIQVQNTSGFTPVIDLRDGCTGSNIACAYTGTGTVTLTYTSLTPTNTYYIRTYDYASGAGTFKISVYNTVPAAPTNDAAGNITCSTFDANWTNNATDASSYRLDVSTSAGFGAGTFVGIYNDLNVANVLTYPVTGLTPNTWYYYRVRAVNDACGTTSNVGSYASVLSLTTPTAPTVAAESNLLMNSFSANWSAIANATSYRLDVATTSGFTAGTFVSGFENLNVGNVTTYAVPSLTCNTGYWYRVRAVNACAQISANSLSESPTTRVCNDDCTAPGVATTLTVGTTFGTYSLSTTSSNSTQTLPAITCASATGNSDDDVWYKFTATCTKATIEVRNISGFTPVIDLRDGCTGSNIACAYTGTGTVTLTYTSLTPTNTYYIRTYDYANGAGTFQISVYNTVPAAPTNDAAGNVTCSTFDANWTNNATDASSYRLDVSTSAGFGAGTFVGIYNDLNVANVLTYPVTGLTPNTWYYYRVRAVNDACGTTSNVGSYASVLSLTTPTAPTVAAESNLLMNSFSANWSAIANATSYRLDVATTSGFTAGTFVSGFENLNVGNVTTYAVPSLTCNTGYWYRVRAVNACAQISANSLSESPTTRVCNDDCTAPGVATTLTVGTTFGTYSLSTTSSNSTQTLPAITCASATGNSDDDVWYKFTATCTKATIEVRNISGFTPVIDLRDGCTGSNIACAYTGTGTVTLTYTSLTPTNTYYIRTYDYANGAGTFQISVYNTVPAAPTNDAAGNITCSTFDANWTNNATDASSYRLDVSTSAGFGAGTFVGIYNDLNVANVLTYPVTGLTPNTWYYYRVRAVNDACGTTSNVGSYASVLSLTTPTAPTVAAESNLLMNSFSANWSAIANATSYRLDVATTSGFTAGTFVSGFENLNVGNVTTYAVPSLTCNTGYWYRVRAVNACAQISANSLSESPTTRVCNDDCTAPGVATTLTVGTTFGTYSLSTTSSNSTQTLPAITCASATGNSDDDVWYKFTATCTKATIEVRNISGFTPVIDLRDGCTGSNIACAYTGTGTVTLTYTSLTPTNTYYIRTYDYANGAGTFQISVYNTVPAAPTNDAAGNVTCSTFDANWTNNATDASSYRLDVSTSAGFGAGTFVGIYNDLNVANVLTYPVTGLTPNTWYYYRVRAVNDACGTTSNVGSYASVLSLTTPTAPTVAAESNLLMNSFSANWSAIANATSYRLDVATTSGFTAGTFVSGFENLNVGNVTTYAVPSLTCNTGYWYRVRAVNACAQISANSLSESPTTRVCNDDCTAPGVATTLTVGTTFGTYSLSTTSSNSTQTLPAITCASATGNSDDDVWYKFVATCNNIIIEVRNVSGFTPVIDLRDGCTGNNIACAYNGTGTVTLTYTSLTATDTYYIRAYDYASGSGSFQISVYNTPPSAPSIGVASNITCNSFSANWSASATASSYRLDVSTVNTFVSYVTGYQDLNVGNVITYPVTGLTPNTTYYYRVRGVADACGMTSAAGSNQVLTTLGPLAYPNNDPETNVTVCSFQANWSSIANAASYRLDVSTSSGFGSFVGIYNNLNVGNVNSYTVTGLAAGTAYYYRTRTVDACGQASANNPTYQAAPTIATALVPTSIAATNVGCSYFDANWNSVTAATNYRLDVSTNSGFGSFVAGYNNLNVGNVTSYAVTGLALGTTYYYRVRAENGCGVSGNSGNITVTTTNIPGSTALSTPLNGATGVCPNSVTTLNWTASTYATGYKLYFGTNAAATNIVNGTNIGNVTTYNPLPLATNTLYYWRVVPTNPCGDGPVPSIRSFATGNLCYCVPPYTYDACPYGMYISNFTTTGGSTNINNSTGCAGTSSSYYANYTMQCVTVIQGSPFNFTITKASSTYLVGARIWVDLNGDNDFADAGEDVWNSVTTGSSFSGSINIPGGTTPKSTALRVRTLYNGVPASGDYCTTLGYGETEDYCVTILPVCAAPTTQASSITFSGVTCSQMNVSWANGNGSSRIVIAKQGSAVTGSPTNNTTEVPNTIFGNGSTIAANEYVVYTGTSNNVTVTSLNPGITYHFKVFEYNCSAGSEKYNTTSPASNSQATTAASSPDAGKDQYLCTGTTSATMAGTGSGTWTKISGAAATITTPGSATTTVTGLASGTYVFRWTGVCGYDDVVIIVN